MINKMCKSKTIKPICADVQSDMGFSSITEYLNDKLFPPFQKGKKKKKEEKLVPTKN